MGALTLEEALRALLPAIDAERDARHSHGAASPEHLRAVEGLAVAKVNAGFALGRAAALRGEAYQPVAKALTQKEAA